MNPKLPHFAILAIFGSDYWMIRGSAGHAVYFPLLPRIWTLILYIGIMDQCLRFAYNCVQSCKISKNTFCDFWMIQKFSWKIRPCHRSLFIALKLLTKFRKILASGSTKFSAYGRTHTSLSQVLAQLKLRTEPRLNARDSTLVVWIRLESYLCSYLNWRGKVEWKTALKTRHQGMQNHAILTNINEWNDNESHFDYFGPFLHIIKLSLHEL